MRIKSIALVALGMLALPVIATGWGNEGHRIVGDIAWHELDRHAKDRVRDLLPQGRYGTLYEAATWADTHARLYSRYDWVKQLHYIGVPSDAQSVQAPADCDCVVGAIEEFAEKLCGEPARSYWLRVNDLRLVAHFVGDIHQPLHVAHPDGKGGNYTDVKFDRQWLNLHKAWDTTMLRARLAEQFSPAAEDEWELGRIIVHDPELAWQDYSRELQVQITDQDRAAWTADLDPNTWASESLQLARQHTFEVEDGDELDDAYYAQAIAVIDQRLKQAGVRLGALLNQSLEGCP